MSKVAKAAGGLVAVGLSVFTFGGSLLAGGLGLASAAAWSGASFLFGKLGSYGLRGRTRDGRNWGPA